MNVQLFHRFRRECKTVDLEERIEAAFRSVADIFSPRAKTMRAPIGITTEALPGYIVLAEGTCSVRLPAPSMAMAGEVVVVVRDTTSGTVTVVPTSGLVSSASSVTITTGQSRSFICSGQDWH